MSLNISHKIQQQPLSFFCKNNSFFKTKFAQLSFYGLKYSPYTEKLILIFEYLQLMSLILLLHPTLYNITLPDKYFIFKAVIYFFKLVNPSHLLTFGANNTDTSIVLTIILVLMIIKYFLCIYIAIISYRNYQGNWLLIRLWSWVFKLQGRILCFFFTSFWIRVILERSFNSHSISFYGIGNSAIVIISSILIGLEYLFTFALETQFWYVLPTENLLSSKNNRTALFTLTQKCLLQILWLIIKSDSLAIAWVYSGLSLAFNLFRIYDFYTVLPFYQLTGLRFHGSLLSYVAALDLAYFTQTCLRASKTDFVNAGINFTIIFWVLLCFFAHKISEEVLMSILACLVTSDSQGSPEFLLHKISVIKQVEKMRKNLADYKEKSYFSYLMNVTQGRNLTNMLVCDREQTEELSQQPTSYLILRFLEELSTRFPRNNLVKLHIALICAKNPQLYIRSLTMAESFEKRKWSASYITASLLLQEIAWSLKHINKENENKLDLVTFIEAKLFLDDIKKEMANQADMRISIMQNIVGEKSNINQIFTCSQEVEISKRKIEKLIKQHSKRYPEYCIEPLVLLAEYHLVMNFSYPDYEKFLELYNNRAVKLENIFSESRLTEENLYHKENAFLMISGQKGETGRIKYCSSSLQQICGGQNIAFRESPVSSLFAPGFRPYISECFKQIFETGKPNFVNNKIRVFLNHKDGSIFQAEMLVWVHPFITRNLYLNMILRPIPLDSEFILVKNSGEIEGMSKSLMNFFNVNQGLDPLSVNIELLSEELHELSEAVKVYLTTEQPQSGLGSGSKELKSSLSQSLTLPRRTSSSLKRKMTYEQASALYNLFSTEGKVIDLSPIGRNSSRYFSNETIRIEVPFHCRFELYKFHDTQMIILYLTPLIKFDTIEKLPSKRHTTRTTQEYFISRRPHACNTQCSAPDEFEFTARKRAVEETEERGSENFDDCDFEKDMEIITEWKRETQTTERNLWSPTSTTRQMLFPTQVTQADDRIQTTRRNASQGSLTSLEENVGKRQHQPRFKIIERRQYAPTIDSMSMQRSQSQGKRSFEAFSFAIKSKSSPKSFSVLCFVFYFVLLITFVSQIILKFVTDSTMTNLVVHKNMLKYAQLRTYRETMLAVRTRGHVLTISGQMDTGDLGGAGQDFVASSLAMIGQSQELKRYNDQVIAGIDALDENVQAKLFQPDVVVYGTYQNSTDKTPKNLTSFQAVNEILNACHVAFTLALTDPISQENLEAQNYIILNNLNSLLINEDAIIDMFLASVDQKKDNFKFIIIVCLIVSPLLLVAVILMLVLIIWNQYRIERNLLLAFIKIDPVRVNYILESLKSMKKSLISEEYIQKKQAKKAVDPTNTIYSIQMKASYWQRKEHVQVIKYKDIIKRYLGHTTKVLVYVAVLIGVTVYNFFSANQSTDEIYNLQGQLFYAGYLSAIIPLYYISSIEIFATNNTNLIKGRKPSEVLPYAIEQVKILRNEIPYKFLNIDSSYDSQVQDVLFIDDGCARFRNVSTLVNFCDALEAKGYRFNLLPLMSAFEDLLEFKLQQMDEVDFTSLPALRTAMYLRVGELLASFGIITAEAQYIMDVVDKNLMAKISGVLDQRMIILVVFSVSLIFINILIWFQILKKLKEVNNDFKKVLQVLPPNFVFSSFLLKSFLIKTSKNLRSVDKLYS